jgi:sialate O-acetylesterase
MGSDGQYSLAFGVEFYGFRGAIYYQGEGNALDAYRYRQLLPTLIEGWRKASRQSRFSFLIAQLPNHGAIPDRPGESAWAELREAQFLTYKRVPDVGLAVTIDVDDRKDLHPHRKAEMGERLALWALGTTYRQPIVYSGPLYDSMDIKGNNVRLHFTHVGKGLAAKGDGPLQGFAVAGADRKFYWANGVIDGDEITISSPQVPQPIAVRYAWGDRPRCNVFNKDGLPAHYAPMNGLAQQCRRNSNAGAHQRSNELDRGSFPFFDENQFRALRNR